MFIVFIANLLLFLEVEVLNILIMYIFYNLVVASFKGSTIGKWALRLEVQASNALVYFLRELFFFLLFPLVVIHFCFCQRQTLHEIISNTCLIRR